MTYEKILVPLDGSALSECALPLACALAARTNARLVLFRATGIGEERPFASSAATVAAPVHSRAIAIDRASSAAGQYLERVVTRLGGIGQSIAVHTASGDPASEILAIAGRERAGLIAMATHARSGLARSVLGSVTDQVVLRSEVPILVVRPSCAPGPLISNVNVRSVLVPLDQSELSESALPHALALAAAFQARITFLTVVQPTASFQEIDKASAYVSGVAAQTGLPRSRAGVTVAAGDPRAEIPAKLRQLPDAVVVMSTRGASGFKRWIRGSVTDTVIRAGLAPTMVVPPVAPILGPAIH